MSNTLATGYDPTAFEARLYAQWEASGVFAPSGKGEPYFISYVGNPAQFGNTIMQPYAGLGEENLQKLAAFLEASKGPKE